MPERHELVAEVAEFLGRHVVESDHSTTWLAQQVLDLVGPVTVELQATEPVDLEPAVGTTELTPIRVRVEALDAAIRMSGSEDWDGSLDGQQRVEAAIARAEPIEAWLLRAGLPDGPTALATVVGQALGKVNAARDLVREARGRLDAEATPLDQIQDT